MLPNACQSTEADKHAEAAFEDVLALADILVTDKPSAFDGLTPINGQLFVLAHRHGHSLEPHYRTVDPDMPIRRLVKIVREVYQNQRPGDYQTDREPGPVLGENELVPANTE
jgi:hypothetical protein